jgi:hypothetical protein
MDLTLIEAATGCVESAEIRLDHLAVIKTIAVGKLHGGLPLMNIAGGGLYLLRRKDHP